MAEGGIGRVCAARGAADHRRRPVTNASGTGFRPSACRSTTWCWAWLAMMPAARRSRRGVAQLALSLVVGGDRGRLEPGGEPQRRRPPACESALQPGDVRRGGRRHHRRRPPAREPSHARARDPGRRTAPGRAPAEGPRPAARPPGRRPARWPARCSRSSPAARRPCGRRSGRPPGVARQQGQRGRAGAHEHEVAAGGASRPTHERQRRLQRRATGFAQAREHGRVLGFAGQDRGGGLAQPPVREPRQASRYQAMASSLDPGGQAQERVSARAVHAQLLAVGRARQGLGAACRPGRGWPRSAHGRGRAPGRAAAPWPGACARWCGPARPCTAPRTRTPAPGPGSASPRRAPRRRRERRGRRPGRTRPAASPRRWRRRSGSPCARSASCAPDHRAPGDARVL